MADLLIKGMEMPKNCAECDDDMIRMIAGCNLWNNGDAARHADCPLVEVPPHGRLVDADKLLIDIMDRNIDQAQFDDYSEFCHAIHEAPTVIEASEDGE